MSLRLYIDYLGQCHNTYLQELTAIGSFWLVSQRRFKKVKHETKLLYDTKNTF